MGIVIETMKGTIMALFGKKKKDKKNEPTNNLNPLDGNNMASYIKSQKPDITDNELVEMFCNLSKPVDDLEHLDEDGELPWGWHTANKDFTDKIHAEYSILLHSWIQAKESRNPLAEHETLHSFLNYMIAVKELCENKDECFAFWCNNVLIGIGVIEKRKKELADLELNMATRLQEYEAFKKAEVFKKSLTDEMLIDTIKENPNIMQKDFYKLYDAEFKSVINEKLYFMAKEGKIERIKSGNSYILKIK